MHGPPTEAKKKGISPAEAILITLGALTAMIAGVQLYIQAGDSKKNESLMAHFFTVADASKPADEANLVPLKNVRAVKPRRKLYIRPDRKPNGLWMVVQLNANGKVDDIYYQGGPKGRDLQEENGYLTWWTDENASSQSVILVDAPSTLTSPAQEAEFRDDLNKIGKPPEIEPGWQLAMNNKSIRAEQSGPLGKGPTTPAPDLDQNQYSQRVKDFFDKRHLPYSGVTFAVDKSSQPAARP